MGHTSAPFVPSPDDIAAGCAEARAAWDEGEALKRHAITHDLMVDLLANILRPLAVELGYLPETVDADSTVCTPAA